MNSITHDPLFSLCHLMDFHLVNALGVSFCCVPAVIYTLIINWLSYAGSSGRLSDVISYFLQMYHMLLHIIHVRQTLHLLSCTRHYRRWCVQIFLQVCCVPDIFAGDNIYWLLSQVPPHIQTDITRERVALQHWGVQSQQGAYIQLQLAVTYVLQGAWCATLPDHRSTWLHIHWQGDTVNIALCLLVLLLVA